MRTLYLLRHAKAENAKGFEADRDRQLSESGRKTCPEIGAFLRDQKHPPAYALCSPATRTLSTMELSLRAATLDIPHRLEPAIYHANDTTRLLHLIHRMDDAFDSVLLVGHNPAMHLLAQHLIRQEDDATCLASYAPGTCAILRHTSHSWHDLAAHSCKLVDYFAPAQRQPRTQ